MVLDGPDILYAIHHGVPRTAEAYYEDVLDDGRWGHNNAPAFATQMFNGHNIQ